MLYEKPKVEILELKTVDVICASVVPDYDGTSNNVPVSGMWGNPIN